MAKKKATRLANEPKQAQNPPQPEDAIGDSVVQLQSLKSLNERLVKETHERRMELGALARAKDALEVDLKRNVEEKNQVIGELGRACEGICELDLEKCVVSVFLQSQMEEMAERKDGMKVEFDGLVEETGDLRGKVGEMERNERVALEEIENLKGKCQKLMGEKMEIEVVNGALLEENESVKKLLDDASVVIEDLERKMGEKIKEKGDIEIVNGDLLKENESVKKLLEESAVVIEGLERKMGDKMRERVEIENDKNGLEMEILKLEEEVAQLNESRFGFEREKKVNEQRIAELESNTGEAMEKVNGMLMEIDALVKQLQKKEKDVEMFTQQRDSLELNLNLLQEEVGNLRRTIEIITRDNVEMEEKKKEAENVIGELQRESSKLKEAMTSLTELSGVEKARNEKLLSEIDRLRGALDEVTLERDDARRSFSDEKGNVEKLSLLLKDKERKLVEAMISQEDSQNIKKEMEKRIDALVGERDSMEKNLLEARSRIDDLRAMAKSAVANSEKALALLKETCMAVCDGYEKGASEASSEPFVEHLDAIRASFTNKERMLEEMKHRLETARAEERKKGFFAIMTATTTTILAAVSAAYVSKAR